MDGFRLFFKQGSKNKYISAFSKLWLIKSIFSCLLERYLDFTHIYIFPYAISIPGFTSTEIEITQCTGERVQMLVLFHLFLFYTEIVMNTMIKNKTPWK
jgi:hypothetical protein